MIESEHERQTQPQYNLKCGNPNTATTNSDLYPEPSPSKYQSISAIPVSKDPLAQQYFQSYDEGGQGNMPLLNEPHSQLLQQNQIIQAYDYFYSSKNKNQQQQ